MPRANNKNVAGAIDTALLGGGNLSNAFSAIFNLSGNNLLNGLTQISGETATGSQQTTFNAMNQFMGIMLDPFIDGRGAAPCRRRFGLRGRRSARLCGQAARHKDAYAAIYRKAPPAPAYDPRWSVWAAAYGGSQTTERQHGARIEQHHQPRCSASAVGADYRFSPNTIAGFALAGGGTNFSVTNGGSGRSDLFQAGAFVRHTIGAGLSSPARWPMAGRTSPPTAP